MISVIVAEDQTMLRQAMVQLLNMSDDIKVVEQFGDGASALRYIQKHSPQVAILDIEMPEMTGLEVLAKVREGNDSTKIIIVTTFKRPGYFEKAVANDVDAYVLKERSVDDLIGTIKSNNRGKGIQCFTHDINDF